MSFDQIKNFVSTQRLMGTNDEDIRSALHAKHWREDIIEKALSESELPPTPADGEIDIASRIFSAKELLNSSLLSLKNNYKVYVLATAVSIALPLAVLVLFFAPIAYDLLVLHLTPLDFLSRELLPIVSIHFILGFLSLITVSMWGSLALLIVASQNGKIAVKEAFKKAWERLPGYALVSILSGLIIIAGFVLLIIPGIIAVIYLSFVKVAYVEHGARGKAALVASVSLVRNRWFLTLGRLLVLGLIMMAFGMFAAALLPGLGSILAQFVITPLAVIFSFALYRNIFAYNKKANEEAGPNTDESPIEE